MSEKIKKEVVKKEDVIEDVDSNVEIDTNLNISEDVIGIIAGLAASEVEGIAGMTLGFVDGINQILGGNKKYSKGVKIEKTKLIILKTNNDSITVVEIEKKI